VPVSNVFALITPSFSALLLSLQTYTVGDVDEVSKKLIKCSHDCLMKALAICKPGVRYRDVGDIITKHASSQG
jgi:methionyl aminopeptidase